MEEIAGWLRLTLHPGAGPAAQRALLAAFGLPDRIFTADHQALSRVVGASLASSLLGAPDQARIDATLEWLTRPGNAILTLGDPAYPAALLDAPDPPVLLYVKGDVAVLECAALAIVGARSATPQGVANADAFARVLASTGLTVVSGLALGIDAAAHRGALAVQGKTIAVIGTGADRVYPARNREIAHAIAEQGAIVSEFPLGAPPHAHHFPRRNRIIAGLCRGVLVVEAAVNSGSLITARLANEAGREVFAIPGSIHSPLARGCHRLIREGAKLVETAEDILEELRWGQSAATPEATTRIRTGARHEHPDPPAARGASLRSLEDEEAKLLQEMGHDPVDIDTLAIRSGLTVEALYAILLALELDGHVSRAAGGRFQRL
ncbi:MAG: DNA-protecting protein DprA [Rhodocyclaceae bacterium]|nr:DNA-protecting protein DprA [Rhodocyclaceae bacterium]